MRAESGLPTLAPASGSPLSAGRKLGDKFEIRGVLGEGGTGIVYEASRLGEEGTLALKVIHAHLAGDKQIRGRFTREAAILRRLQGSHLCPILEFGELPDPRREDAGLLYMALPKIEGPGLDALLKREGPLPMDRALDLMLQVCEGLKEAHAQGVIHRDLKPGNVLVSPGDHAIVVDFGMAKIVTGGGTGTTALTQHNMVFGTPEYMAPEQARGDELDARCDVYAAGIMLYELITGVVPFHGATPLNVLTAHLTTAPLPPREQAPERGISAALEAVVLAAIAKDPSERYATASAFASAILRAREAPDDTTSVRPPARITVNVGEEDAHSPTLPGGPVSSRTGRVLREAEARRTPQSQIRTEPPQSAVVRAPPAKVSAGRGWTLLWLVAAVIGTSIGVWLSLRGR